MTTRPYTECRAQALALCGIPDSNATEVARMDIFLNRRAKQAYAKSELWPRWLVVGEERIVSEEGLLPYSQDGLRTIGTVKRIHESEPFKTNPAGEYIDWNAQSDGVQITGYVPVSSSMDGGLLVSGDATASIYDFSIAANRDIPIAGQYSAVGVTYNDKEQFSTNGSVENESVVGGWFLFRYDVTDGWQITGTYNSNGGLNYWYEGFASGLDSPVDVSVWLGGGGVGGSFTVTAVTTYSAFITYKAAFSTTYGTGDGEESEVPEEWFEWMATGGAADFKFSDGDTETGLLLKGEAQTDIDDQLDKISHQNGAHLHTAILTHGNTQAR